MVVQEDDDGERLTGNYEVLDEVNVRLELSNERSETQAIVVMYGFSSDTLVLTAPDGDTSTMTRVSR